MKKYLDPKKFRCKRCGECCRSIVKVNEKDITKIEKLGYVREEFLDYDPLKENLRIKDTLKQSRGVCMFLRKRGKKYHCLIYDYQPKNCRNYPFYNDKIKIISCGRKHWLEEEPLRNIVKEG